MQEFRDVMLGTGIGVAAGFVIGVYVTLVGLAGAINRRIAGTLARALTRRIAWPEEP